MDGSQSIDPQMIRDHDVDMKALHAAIRDIEAEAWDQQDRLRLAHPQVEGRHQRWRRDQPSSHAGLHSRLITSTELTLDPWARV
jgi:hypothetical protein